MNKNISNIASFLPEMASSQPYKTAIAYPSGRDRKGRVSYININFKQLDYESDLIAKGLFKVGIGRGTRTILMIKPSLEFFVMTFALFKLGTIPVLIDPGIGTKNLKKCIAESEPEVFIGIPKAMAARIIFGWGKKTVKKIVTVGPRLFWGGFSFDEILAIGIKNKDIKLPDTSQDDTAAILFTSGSTGIPKGVIYTHSIFINQVKQLKDLYNIEKGEIDLCTFPLFALFSPALGMTAIIPEMDAAQPALVDPKKIVETINNFGVTNMFGSPALINRVGRYGASHNIKLNSIKRVISAGAPVSANVLETFSKMLSSDVQIYTPYGATESLPVCSIGSHDILNETRKKTDEGKGVCVGYPVKCIELYIIKIADEPIDTWSETLIQEKGKIGEIVVKGPVVSKEYFNRIDSTKLAKIYDPEKNETYHRMGDLGYLDELGRLWFCGRKSHRVITPDETLYTIPCEAVFNTHPSVYRTAIVPSKKNGTIYPVLCVELEEDIFEDEDKIKLELLAIGQNKNHTKNIKNIQIKPFLPVDIRHNSKIIREELAKEVGFS